VTQEAKDIHNTDARLLARLIDTEGSAHRLWSPEELGAIFRHEISAPVEYSLEGVDSAVRGGLARLCASHGLLIRSIADLLNHPNPPVELLALTKDYAKASREHPEGVLPPEVATVLYFACIAAALVRCGRHITELADESVRHGMEWGASIPWLDDGTRALFMEALRFLKAQKGAEA
jgi:hypothetical protein